MLDGAPILGVITGLALPSRNAKTGDMLQTYILREDLPPPEAVRTGADRSICGDCALRGDGNGLGRACYVQTKWAPLAIWKAVIARSHGFDEVDYREDQSALPIALCARTIRLGTYGDPVAIPAAIWEWLLTTARGHTGYTHQWRTAPDAFKYFCMASVDSAAERSEAVARGWRTFRVRQSAAEAEHVHEITCPASAEAGHRTTCAACLLCNGRLPDDRRTDITIIAHGSRATKVGAAVLPFEDEGDQP